MAEGFAVAEANSILSGYDGAWIQLHVGAPGANGTANQATETTRQQCSFGSPSGGSIANDAPVTWTNIAGSEDATHFTAWTADSGGTFLFSGLVTGNAYSAGDTITAGVGALTASIPVAS